MPTPSRLLSQFDVQIFPTAVSFHALPPTMEWFDLRCVRKRFVCRALKLSMRSKLRRLSCGSTRSTTRSYASRHVTHPLIPGTNFVIAAELCGSPTKTIPKHPRRRRAGCPAIVTCCVFKRSVSVPSTSRPINADTMSGILRKRPLSSGGTQTTPSSCEMIRR